MVAYDRFFLWYRCISLHFILYEHALNPHYFYSSLDVHLYISITWFLSWLMNSPTSSRPVALLLHTVWQQRPKFLSFSFKSCLPACGFQKVPVHYGRGAFNIIAWIPRCVRTSTSGVARCSLYHTQTRIATNWLEAQRSSPLQLSSCELTKPKTFLRAL